MVCGPELMQHACAEWLLANDMPAGDIWLSLGATCGAPPACAATASSVHFICRDGPVFRYDVIRHLARPGI